MTTQIVRIGNTLTVEIPEEAIAQTDLRVGEPVDWIPNGRGGIELVKRSDSAPARPRRRKTLDEILEGIPEGVCTGEIDWGHPQGVEVW